MICKTPMFVILLTLNIVFGFDYSDFIPEFFSDFIERNFIWKSGECCADPWIVFDSTALISTWDTKVYGQPLAKKVIVKHIKAHFNDADPHKALALSFHGTAGTGKNFVSKIIAESIYKKGMKSKFVHIIPATTLTKHIEKVSIYKNKIQAIIENSTSLCERSLFIFDEIDKMPPGIIDTIKPYLDFHEHLDGVNYRKTMFLFLSNTGGTDITRYTLKHWFNGKDRESIELSDMENIIASAAYNMKKGGLWHSDLLLKHMMTAYVPFLPLERRHVKLCIRDALLYRKFYRRAEDIETEKERQILKELSFFPEREEIVSVTGCKRVLDKVDYVMEEDI